MQINFNGKTLEIAEPICLKDLLLKLSYHPDLVAIAVDGIFVPRSDWHLQLVKDGSTLVIVAPMQGG
jgi:thiamine biosynthesis protein ThiS